MEKIINKEWVSDELFLYIKDKVNKKESADHINVISEIVDLLNEKCKSADDVIEIYDLLKTIFLQYPLTPIYDNMEEWNFEEESNAYISKRYPSLFRKIADNGEDNYYKDLNRFICIDLVENKFMEVQPYHDSFIEGIVNVIYPIEFPYQPTSPIKIFVEKFNYYKDREKWDTLAITYIRLPNGKMQEIKKFFKHNLKISESGDIIKNELIEIGLSEYVNRKQKYESRKKNENE